MPRESLNRHIRNIQDEVLLLGSMVSEAVHASIEALKKRDVESAHKIFRNDQDVNGKRYAIENAILILIATQQPMAHDLRMLAAMLEVITELERIGDYAKGIAKVVIRIGDTPLPIPMREIERMADLANGMLHRALTSFMEENPNLAAEIPPEDDAVDNLYNHVYHSLISSMIANPGIIDQASLLMWVAHNLERMADRTTNICERTIFIATGELMELETDDEDSEYD
jgi:phosphate transport system protein